MSSLLVQLVDFGSRLLPVRIMRNIAYRVDQFVQQVAAEHDLTEYTLIDVGAETTPYRKYFHKVKYCTLDKTQNEAGTIDFVTDINQGAPMIADGTIDFILCTQVLEHLKEPALVFREFHRILKPGGKLFLTTHLCFEEHMQPYDYFRFTQYGLRYLGESAGFVLQHIAPHGGIFQVIALIVSTLPIKLFLRRYSTAYYLYLVLFAVPIFLFNLVCCVLDFLDTRKEMTLNYECIYLKPGA